MIRTPAMSLGLAFAAAACAALPTLAQAQLSANLGLTSNYKFRGQDQDTSRQKALKPALQGGLDYAFGDSGWYVGNWNSSVDWLTGNSLEVDLYGGHKFKAGALDLDLGAMVYVYPGNRSGNTTELYGAASWQSFTARYAHTVSKDYFGWAGAQAGSGLRGRNTGYLNLAWAQPIAPQTTLKAAVGYTRFASDIHRSGVPHYVDYSVGASYDFGDGLALGAALVGANQKAYFGDANKPRLVVALTKAL